MSSDNDFLLHVLSDGQWHSRDEILALSFRERGCGLTVHSRASDLRKRGLTVLCDTENNTTNRRTSFYRIVALEEAAPSMGAVSSSASSPAESLAASGEGALTNREGRGADVPAVSAAGGETPGADAPPDVSPQPGDASGDEALDADAHPITSVLLQAPGALTLFAAPRGAYGD